jgi:hypothetical protein
MLSSETPWTLLVEKDSDKLKHDNDEYADDPGGQGHQSNGAVNRIFHGNGG